MNLSEFDFAKLFESLQAEIALVASTLRDKGAGHFRRPFAVAAAALILSAVVYNHPAGRRRDLEKRLNAAKATSEYAEPYKEIREALLVLHRQLPQLKDRDQLLLNALVDSMKAENITPDGLKPPMEEEVGTLIYQSVTMSSSIKFSDLMSWLSRIENAKPAMQVTQLSLTKRTDQIGVNNVSCVIGTIIPKGRY